MRVLGIDPGSKRLGFGLVDTSGEEPELVTSGVFGLDQETDENYQSFRIRLIRYWISNFYNLPECDLIVTEIVPSQSASGFVGGAVQSDLVKVAITVIHTMALLNDVEFREVSASTVKKSMYGSATKPAVRGTKKKTKVSKVDIRNAVQEYFPELRERKWEVDLMPDETDAIAIALTGAGFSKAKRGGRR